MMKKILVSKKQYKFINKAYRLIAFFTILGLLIAYALVIDKPIEFCLIFIPYFITKNFYSKQWHASSVKQCFIVSLMVFILATTTTLNRHISIMFSFVTGLFIAYLSHHAGVIKFKLKDYAYIEPRYNQLVEWYNERKEFNIDTCTKEELIDRCKELKISNSKVQEIYDLFNMPIEEYMDKNNIEYQSVCNKRQRYRKKFNK